MPRWVAFTATFLAAVLACGCVLVASIVWSTGVYAQSIVLNPRTVRLVVPAPAGGGTDALARLIAPAIAEAMGQPVVVENRPGGAGIIAMEAVARAAPNGQTLLIINSSQAIVSALGKKSTVNLLRDFEPVALLGSSPLMIAAASGATAGTLVELVAAARKRHPPFAYASCGSGSSSHFVGEMLRLSAGIELLHVPYRGCAPAVHDAVGKQVDLVVASIPSVLPNLRTGRLRALAVTSPKRVPTAPDVPTVSELGFPDASLQALLGLLAPAGTPARVVRQIADRVIASLSDSANRDWLEKAGIEESVGTGDALRELLQADLQRYAEMMRHAGIELE